MRRFNQLTAAEQQRAVEFTRAQVAVDPEIADDATVTAKLDQIAHRRAQEAYYLEPGDRLISLPPPPVP